MTQQHIPTLSNLCMQHRVAVVAGTGTLPLAAICSLQKSGIPFFVVSLFSEVNGTALRELTSEVVAEKFYKMGSIIALLKKQQTTHVLFIGKVDKRNLLKKISYDWLFAKLAAKALIKNDSALMELLIAELLQHGIQTLSQRDVLSTLFIPPGVLTGTLSDALRTDIKLGLSTATQLSQCDIGQTVVVKNGMVLAIEAIEGTDECITRGAALGKGNVVVCKTARTTQSDAYDIPTIGPTTLAKIVPGDVAVVAWHAQRTMIAEVDELCKVAQEKNIVLVSE